MDFQQASYTLTIRFRWSQQVRCRSLYFKFDDTVSGNWLTVRIVYKEWWVPAQVKYYVGEGDHTFSLYSAWKVKYVDIILYELFIWDQKVFIDYLALKTV